MVEVDITSIEQVACCFKTSHTKDVWIFPYKMQQSATTKGSVGDFGKACDSKLALKAWYITLPGVGGGLNAMLSDYLTSHSFCIEKNSIQST